MSLSPSEEGWLEDFLVAASESTRLSAWEQSFVASQEDSFGKYGTGMMLSRRQWGVLRRVADKIGHDVTNAGDGE